MADLNNCSFTGRLTKDAKKKVLPTGTPLVEFTIAVNTGWGDYKKTLFLTCNLWGKNGTNIYSYLTKGKHIAVCGTMEVQEWEDDAGSHTKNVMNTRDVILIGATPVQSDTDVPHEDITF